MTDSDDDPASRRSRPTGPTVGRRTILGAGAAGLAAWWLSGRAVGAQSGTNPVAVENQQQGTTGWRITQTSSDDVVKQIKGYAGATSVNRGETITFYVTVNPVQTFTMDVYRMGHYQGTGGRLMLHVDAINGVTQPDCSVDPATGTVSCAWNASYQLTIPSAWTSGVYLVKLTNNRGFQNYITFVVRDDSSQSDLLYQQSVTTYQAYNNYPNDVQNGSALPATGKSLYDYNSSPTGTGAGTTRAVKVSFDRPYANDDGAGDFLDWEFYFVRWLEQSGFDVSYCTDLDTHVAPERLANHRGFLSVGHDEYWSKAMYDGVRAALDAGVGLGFFGANAVYWQIRLEPSAVGTPNRIQVCYKDVAKDPVSGPTTTVTWRHSALNRPEQQLLGSMFVAQQPGGAAPAAFTATNTAHWVFAGTGMADGDTVAGVVGYECDKVQPNYPPPTAVPGTYTVLSDSPFTTSLTSTDGSSAGVTDRANAVIYQAGSGAFVFNAGSIEWSWGLTNFGSHSAADPRMQRITANVLTALSAGAVAIPAAPTALTATPLDAASVSLAWTDNARNETGFVLEHSMSAAFDPVVTTSLSADTTTLTDTGLAPGVHYYRVRAVNSNGSSTYSNTAVAATVAYHDLVQGRSGLQSHWRLGESGGTVAADSKGTADGTYVNATSLGLAGAIARDPDGAAGFNGTTNKVSLPALASTIDFTVEGWSYLTSTNANSTLYGTNNSARILVRPGAGASAYAGVWLNNGEYALQPSTQDSNLNTWVHWVLTRSGSTLTLYRNGTRVAQRTDLPATASANVSGWIGAQGGSAYYFGGRIDEVAVYSSALPSDAVTDNYWAGRNGRPPVPPAKTAYRDLIGSDAALLAYWRLGDARTTVAADSTGRYPGSYVNGVVLGSSGAVNGDPDTSATFNGASHKVSLPALPTVTDFTVEGWSYLTANAVANSNGNNALYGANNQLRLLVRPGAGNTATDVLAGVWLGGTEFTLQPTSTQSNLNTWVHWVLTRAGATLTLYRNGRQVAQRADLPATAAANVAGWIGAQGGNAYYLNGRIDEVAVYTAALRASVVAAHYAAAQS